MMDRDRREPIEKKILDNYRTPGHPTSFGGIQTIYKYYGKEIPIKKIREIMKHSNTYTLHKESRRTQRNPYYIYHKRQQFQIDLIDVQELSMFNEGINFLLTCIDVFTKKAFVRVCKNKSAREVVAKFSSIVEEGGAPETLISDKGSEIKNRLFKKFCSDREIRQIYPENEVHAAIVERFNKTIQMLIYKYLTEKETNRYIDNLQQFVSTYNLRFHRSIGMTPNEAELTENHGKVFMKVDEKIRKANKNRKSAVFQIGDKVRLKRLKRVFDRSYLSKYSEEIFTVSEIKDNLAIITYKLKDLLDEPILGSFYANEFSAVADAGMHKINKILKRRRQRGVEEVLVSWKGYGKKFNNWIPARSVEDIS
jgi:hypothetical protein